MPFEEDYVKYTFSSFRDSETTTEQKMSAEKLVDSMMLGKDEFVSTKMPNPTVRSLNRTLIQSLVKGAVKEEKEDVDGGGNERLTGEGGGIDIVDCVGLGEIVLKPTQELLERADGALKRFISMYDLEEVVKAGAGKRKKRYWSEIDDEEEYGFGERFMNR